MNLKALNDIFRQELGEEPPIKWVNVHDRELYWPAEVFIRGTWPPEPAFDYVCGCGVNMRIHKPSCTTLSVPQRRFELRHYFEIRDKFKQLLNERAHVVVQGIPTDTSNWESQYGSIPRMNVLWQPIFIEGLGMAITKTGVKPDEEGTRSFCFLIKRHRSKEAVIEANARFEQREEEARKAAKDKNMAILDKVTGVRVNVGKVDGNVSLPTPKRSQRGTNPTASLG